MALSGEADVVGLPSVENNGYFYLNETYTLLLHGLSSVIASSLAKNDSHTTAFVRAAGSNKAHNVAVNLAEKRRAPRVPAVGRFTSVVRDRIS